MTAPSSLERAYEVGRRTYPDVSLSFEAFASRRGAVDAPRVPEDYYLARACDVGACGAWEQLRCCYAGLLRILLLARGAGSMEAEQILDETWSELGAPPPSGRTRTRIGTYDGRGALHAWLATFVRRRLAERWRSRAPASSPDEVAQAPSIHMADPVAHSEEAELSDLLGTALENAWHGLTVRERQALVLKYRGHRPQTDIAHELEVGAPRVARLLQAARAKLRAFIVAEFGPQVLGAESEDCRARLLATVEHILAREAADVPFAHPEATDPD